MKPYDPSDIETKWQRRWEREGVFRVGRPDEGRPKYYCLEMLPYPSGRLHMGHVRNYSIGDAVARFRVMRGEQVFHVIGWDAFGLPAENAAIQHGRHPREWTLENIDVMRSQLRRLGLSYDWSREVTTCLPDYYRWNQWLFLRMLEHDLVYRAERLLNWCPSCATVLANEQVQEGRCWRCDSEVDLREFEQWFMRTTRYADELDRELDRLERWPDRVRLMQRNWIGRSDGATVRFGVADSKRELEVFTTRVDTIYGATYLALAAEHPAVEELARGTDQENAVRAFVEEQRSARLADRFADAAEKSGVFSGRYAIHPFSDERVPIWIANFVLADVGTGAVMSVPAHDSRDFAFAKRYGIPIRPVVRPTDGEPLDPAEMDDAFTEYGVLHDSGEYSGLTSEEARRKMAEAAEALGFGGRNETFRLKDWGLSRQRYWGTPIPVVHCADCGIVGVPDDQLPVVLPDDVELGAPGGSPLSRSSSFVEVDCPKCGRAARRDTDTMDTFVDSCWYYFRYTDPGNGQAPFDWHTVRPWFPVDLYIGGIEHATMHLIYTRFWTKAMRDIGLVDIDEPVTRLFTQGMVIKDGFKMSKSRGNIVDPDAMIERFGADTTRLFALFAAPPERDLDWSEKGIEGCHRFLSRVWRTFERVAERLPPADAPTPAGADADDALALRRVTHATIERVTRDLGPRMHLNTAVSAMMEHVNAIAAAADTEDPDSALAWAIREAFDVLARLLAPFAPHACEELWERLGHDGLVTRAAWPVPIPELLVHDEVTIVVQVNGKLRARLTVGRDTDEAALLEAAKEEPPVRAQMDGKTVRKVVHVPNKLLNIVVA